MEMKDITEATAPAKAERKLLEKDIQKTCVDWARARGYWARKFSSMTQRSVPDYLFAKIVNWEGRAPIKLKFAVEFKRPGETSTPNQVDEQKAMVAAGWLCLEISDFETFKYEVERMEKTCGSFDA